MELVLSDLVSITLQHHCLYIVIQDFTRYVTEEAERIAVTRFQRVTAHILGELNVQHPAEPKNSNGHMKGRLAITHEGILVVWRCWVSIYAI